MTNPTPERRVLTQTAERLIQTTDLPWSRKPRSWDEVRDIPLYQLRTDLTDQLEHFRGLSPEAAPVDLLDTYVEGWEARREEGEPPQVFVLYFDDSSRFLIDRSGYEYARYVLRMF